MPHGGFYYTPKSLRKHWRHGGLIYAFGEAKEQLEAPVSECKNGTEDGAAAGQQNATTPWGSAPAEDASRRVCVICLDEDATYASLPCGHLAYCGNCQGLARERNHTCPVCRCAVRERIRIY